jgi:hypothetical protein
MHRPIENEEVSVYCNANVNISHVAPPGTESDANYLATSFPHEWARRNKQGHTKGVELLLDEHKKILIQLFSPTHKRTEGRAPVWGSEFTSKRRSTTWGIQQKPL